MAIVPRLVEPLLSELLTVFRIVLVNGPRQAGKTTLLRRLLGSVGGELRSLDEPAPLALAANDPVTFVTVSERPLIVDEVQRGGDPLVLAIKFIVDGDNTPGQFVLSGSTRFLTVPTLSESLAGRMAIVELWPLSMAERVGGAGDFCVTIFGDPTSLLAAPRSPWTRDEYLDLCCIGGFPEAIRAGTRTRGLWFEGYLQTVIDRDIRAFADLHEAAALPTLLATVAARSGSTLVNSDIAQALGLSQPTVRNYLRYLETVFLQASLPPWFTNLTSKVVKARKSYLTDVGLAAHLLRVAPDALHMPGHPALGGLVETLVFTELTRLIAPDSSLYNLRYFRDRDGREIDFIIEGPGGRVVPIEVKASASPKAHDARHLHWLKEKLGDQMAAGVLLHLGDTSGSLGDGILMLPVSALWGHGR